MINYKKVIIEWNDASFHDGHFSLDEGVEFITQSFETMGFLLERNKEFITIACSANKQNKSVCDIYKIPIGCIKKLRYLK